MERSGWKPVLVSRKRRRLHNQSLTIDDDRHRHDVTAAAEAIFFVRHLVGRRVRSGIIGAAN